MSPTRRRRSAPRPVPQWPPMCSSGVPLDEIAARVCTDQPDDRDVDRDVDPAGRAAPLETTRAWRSWPELGRRAIGSTWVLTRAMSPVRVPLPEPPGIVRRAFPGAHVVARRVERLGVGVLPGGVARPTDLRRGVRCRQRPAGDARSRPLQGHPTRDIAQGTAGVVCDPRALPAGARRRCPTRRRWNSVGEQSRPGRPAAVPGRAGHQRDHVRPRRSAERPGSAVADVAESYGAARGGVPAAPRPRGVAASSRTRRARTRRHHAVLRTDHERHRRGGLRGRPRNGWRCPTCKAVSSASRSPRRPRRPPDDLRRLQRDAPRSRFGSDPDVVSYDAAARLVTHHIAC